MEIVLFTCTYKGNKNKSIYNSIRIPRETEEENHIYIELSLPEQTNMMGKGDSLFLSVTQ